MENIVNEMETVWQDVGESLTNQWRSDVISLHEEFVNLENVDCKAGVVEFGTEDGKQYGAALLALWRFFSKRQCLRKDVNGKWSVPWNTGEGEDELSLKGFFKTMHDKKIFILTGSGRRTPRSVEAVGFICVEILSHGDIEYKIPKNIGTVHLKSANTGFIHYLRRITPADTPVTPGTLKGLNLPGINGGILMDRAHQYFKEQKASSVVLEPSKGNEGLVNLYSRYNFHVMTPYDFPWFISLVASYQKKPVNDKTVKEAFDHFGKNKFMLLRDITKYTNNSVVSTNKRSRIMARAKTWGFGLRGLSSHFTENFTENQCAACAYCDRIRNDPELCYF